MNKKEFLEHFDVEDKNEIAKIYEKYQVTDYGISSYTDEFYSPNIWNKILNLQKKLQIQVETCGYFEESERRIIFFKGEYLGEIPIKLYKIKNLSKFKELKHKDYLGSLMGLGIKREKIGDLIVKDEFCYFPTFEEIGKIIINELKTVGHNPVEITLSEEVRLEANLESFNITISSGRLDALVAAITKISREECIKLIERGEINVNYEVLKDKSFKLKEKDIISIKKYGKYRYEKVLGNTKKDKEKIEIKKFI